MVIPTKPTFIIRIEELVISSNIGWIEEFKIADRWIVWKNEDIASDILEI